MSSSPDRTLSNVAASGNAGPGNGAGAGNPNGSGGGADGPAPPAASNGNGGNPNGLTEALEEAARVARETIDGPAVDAATARIGALLAQAGPEATASLAVSTFLLLNSFVGSDGRQLAMTDTKIHALAELVLRQNARIGRMEEELAELRRWKEEKEENQ